MNQHWRATNDSLHLEAMPFYWRLSNSTTGFQGISQLLPIDVKADEQFDYLKFEPSSSQWAEIDAAYHQNENIGFLNPESGQMATYGASVNNFFLRALQMNMPKRIYEIGCGAGYSIRFLREHGFDVTGVDPSEYSKRWSERLGFRLINDFFREGLLDERPDFVYCNDVFEHVRDVPGFSRMVHDCLSDEGTFCIATTSSTRSIELGDISMFEHQHVNMFTERSIRLILREAGFSKVEITGGTYGNTFHVIAHKQRGVNHDRTPEGLNTCFGYFERAASRISAFARYYETVGELHAYVPLRCIPYLATVGDYGRSFIYDSNVAWRGKYIDGYTQPIQSLADVYWRGQGRYFIGSLTFFNEIRRSLIERGCPPEAIDSIENLR
jgi:2-polyprenyl-3-methyl-5-hydroxy-6-metoxy-1,4-benzoquinol methylase